MPEKWSSFRVVALFSVLILAFLLIGYYLGRGRPYYTEPSNVEYINNVAGLNLYDLGAGNYSYPLEIKNPWDDLSIRLYCFLFAEPPAILDYVSFSCTVRNSTVFGPNQKTDAVVRLTITENPYGESELYFRVGCYRLGVDY